MYLFTVNLVNPYPCFSVVSKEFLSFNEDQFNSYKAERVFLKRYGGLTYNQVLIINPARSTI